MKVELLHIYTIYAFFQEIHGAVYRNSDLFFKIIRKSSLPSNLAEKNPTKSGSESYLSFEKTLAPAPKSNFTIKYNPSQTAT